MCYDYKCSRITFFLPPFMLKKKKRVIFLVGLVGDVLDGNIINGCNGKVGM